MYLLMFVIQIRRSGFAGEINREENTVCWGLPKQQPMAITSMHDPQCTPNLLSSQLYPNKIPLLSFIPGTFFSLAKSYFYLFHLSPRAKKKFS